MFQNFLFRKRFMALVFSWLFVPALIAADAFSLAPLPYGYDALEPAIDKATMQIHHGKHHQAYVNNLNAQVATYPELKAMSVEQIMASVSKYNAAVRNNGGGH